MKKNITSIIIAIVLIAGAFMLTRGNGSEVSTVPVNNVTIVDGKQTINIDAKGGYSPKLTTAKADMPTVIRVATNATFDCSSALTIPALGYRSNLPASGITEIEVPPQKGGTGIQGICAMGMYNFLVNFN